MDPSRIEYWTRVSTLAHVDKIKSDTSSMTIGGSVSRGQATALLSRGGAFSLADGPHEYPMPMPVPASRVKKQTMFFMYKFRAHCRAPT